MLILLLSVCSPAFALEFTSAEEEYIKNNPEVRLCVDPDWVPFERINEDGKHEGIAADLLALISSRTGITFTLVPTKDWDESLALSKSGGCDALSFLNSTPQREEWLIFTEPHFTDSNVFVTREEHSFIADPADLPDETIVFPKGTAMEELIRRDYPNLKIILTDSEIGAFNMVSDRKADMTMRSLIMAAYTIKKQGLFNLKISGRLPGYKNYLRMGVVKEKSMLRGILNKGIATITNAEREEIINRHVSINVQTPANYRLLMQIFAVAAVLLIIFIRWNMKLRELNKRLEKASQTDVLTGLYNRTMIDSRYYGEFERSRRYVRPFSVIMFDVDHFKEVNDKFGHLEGDKVLVKIAAALKETVRNSDIAGRWGGEEFLILCPETAADDAVILAERIRAAVRSLGNRDPQQVTVSLGIAQSEESDTPDTLLLRADKALYQAKNSGRDRVCRI
ncbi:diguanylate cyclase [Geovibrio thiophilus]|uniref:diguanylate cyclase n=1 Tax=Geovibrio thiophilus TaxID=139438 RepID=A0A3R5XZD9_9BACT|nr:diguanylate cyclase [Geovibrio thiophilus]